MPRSDYPPLDGIPDTPTPSPSPPPAPASEPPLDNQCPNLGGFVGFYHHEFVVAACHPPEVIEAISSLLGHKWLRFDEVVTLQNAVADHFGVPRPSLATSFAAYGIRPNASIQESDQSRGPTLDPAQAPAPAPVQVVPGARPNTFAAGSDYADNHRPNPNSALEVAPMAGLPTRPEEALSSIQPRPLDTSRNDDLSRQPRPLASIEGGGLNGPSEIAPAPAPVVVPTIRPRESETSYDGDVNRRRNPLASVPGRVFTPNSGLARTGDTSAGRIQTAATQINGAPEVPLLAAGQNRTVLLPAPRTTPSRSYTSNVERESDLDDSGDEYEAAVANIAPPSIAPPTTPATTTSASTSNTVTPARAPRYQTMLQCPYPGCTHIAKHRSMIEHKLMTHLGLRCMWCNMSFQTEQETAFHYNSHAMPREFTNPSGQRRYKCLWPGRGSQPICPKDFARHRDAVFCARRHQYRLWKGLQN